MIPLKVLQFRGRKTHTVSLSKAEARSSERRSVKLGTLLKRGQRASRCGLVLAVIATTSALITTSANATPIDVGASSMIFRNSTAVDIGPLAEAGFSHRYNDVVTVGGRTVDAILTVLSVTNLDSDDDEISGANNKIDKVDDETPLSDEIDLSIDVFGSACDLEAVPPCTGNTVIRVAFVEDETSIAATLRNVKITVVDIDSRQFVEYSAVSQYKLTTDPLTELTVSTPAAGRTRFTAGLAPSSSSHEENWAEVTFDQLSFVDIKIGADQSGGASFGISFSEAPFVAPTTTTNVAAPTYTLSYDNNGSTDSVAPSATSGSGALTVAAATTRTGFTFAGWNTAADGSGISIAAGSSYSPASSLTLYAQWANLTVTYDKNNAGATTPTGGSTTTIAGGTLTSLATTTLTGATFTGWFTAPTGGTRVTATAPHGQTATFTLYAQWSFLINYAAGTGGSGDGPSSPTSTLGGETFVTPANTYSRAGHTFAGWSDGTSTYAVGDTYSAVSTNVTLTALWTAVAPAPAPAPAPTPTTTTIRQRRVPTFNTLTDRAFPNSSFVLVASSGDELVTLAANTPKVCRVVGESVVFVSRGRCEVQALVGGAQIHLFTTRVLPKSPVATPGLEKLNNMFIYFDGDSDVLRPRAIERLREILLELRTARAITVSGHAADAGDPQGKVARDLSQRRALNVAAFFRSRGIDVTVRQGYGKTQLVSAERAKNRRVEIAWFIPQP